MNPDDDPPPVDAASAMRLIRDQRAATAQRLEPDPRLHYWPWGVAWLVGFGLFFLRFSPGGRTFVAMPEWLPLTTLFVLLGAAAVVFTLGSARAYRQVTGESARRGGWYGAAWGLGFAEPVHRRRPGLRQPARRPGRAALVGARRRADRRPAHGRRRDLARPHPVPARRLAQPSINIVGVLAGPGWHALVVARGRRRRDAARRRAGPAAPAATVRDRARPGHPRPGPAAGRRHPVHPGRRVTGSPSPACRNCSAMTAGNLSVHLRKLEDAGYVEIDKTHRGRTPTTLVRLSRRGRLAFEEYTDDIRALLDPTDSRGAVMILARADQVTRRYGDVLALDRVDLEVRRRRAGRPARPERRRQEHPDQPAGRAAPADRRPGRTLRRRPPRPGDPAAASGSPRRRPACPARCGSARCVDFVSAHFPDPVPRGELLDRFGLDRPGPAADRRPLRRPAASARGRAGLRRPAPAGASSTSRPPGWTSRPAAPCGTAIRSFHADGGTVLLTSHYLEEVEALAQRVVVLGEGRVLADDTVDAVRGVVGVRRVSLVADDLPRRCPGWSATEHVDGRTHLLTTDADQLVRDLVTAGVRLPRPGGPPHLAGGGVPRHHRRPAQPATAAAHHCLRSPLMPLALIHARYQLLEIIRIPVAVIGSAFFPAAAMLFFVVPFAGDDPVGATYATAVDGHVRGDERQPLPVRRRRRRGPRPALEPVHPDPAGRAGPAPGRPDPGRPGADVPVAAAGGGDRGGGHRGPGHPGCVPARRRSRSPRSRCRSR